MFKFLKEKIKNTISKISQKIDQEGATERVEEEKKVEIKQEITIPPAKKEVLVQEQKEETDAQKYDEDIEQISESIEEYKDELIIKEKTKKIGAEETKQRETKLQTLAKTVDVDELLNFFEDESKEEEEIRKIEEEKKRAEEQRLLEEKRREEERLTEEARKEEKKGFFSKIKETFVKKEQPSAADIKKEAVKSEEKADESDAVEKDAPLQSEAEPKKEEKKEKKGIFGIIKEKIETKKISENQFEEMFWDMEMALLESNVAVEVIEKIKADLKDRLVEKPIRRYQIESTIRDSLKHSISELFLNEHIDLLKKIKEKKEKPFVIAFVGINGSGKTTTISKMAKLLKDKHLSVVLAASDTFRAASIEQLQIHADNIGIKMIKHDYGSDPAAVAYDAIQHAKSKNADVVLIDTAGRMHSNTNLIDEMKKIIRISQPDLKIFIGEAITGNDCIEQARNFNDAIGIDGTILAKADIDEKGGAAVSVSYITKKPILYIGTGQNYADLEPFDKNKIIKSLGLVA